MGWPIYGCVVLSCDWVKEKEFVCVKEHLVKSLLKSGLKKLHHDTWQTLMKMLKKMDPTGEEKFNTHFHIHDQ